DGAIADSLPRAGAAQIAARMTALTAKTAPAHAGAAA
ncbi:ABC transporter ATP-binding protein, partial [Streptomyces sp. NPDC088178]